MYKTLVPRFHSVECFTSPTFDHIFFKFNILSKQVQNEESEFDCNILRTRMLFNVTYFIILSPNQNRENQFGTIHVFYISDHKNIFFF